MFNYRIFLLPKIISLCNHKKNYVNQLLIVVSLFEERPIFRLWFRALVLQTKMFIRKEMFTTLKKFEHSLVVDICEKFIVVCPRSCNPFYIVSYYIKWVTTSWTYSIWDSFCFIFVHTKILGTKSFYFKSKKSYPSLNTASCYINWTWLPGHTVGFTIGVLQRVVKDLILEKELSHYEITSCVFQEVLSIF